jgi:hypothetical protein
MLSEWMNQWNEIENKSIKKIWVELLEDSNELSILVENHWSFEWMLCFYIWLKLIDPWRLKRGWWWDFSASFFVKFYLKIETFENYFQDIFDLRQKQKEMNKTRNDSKYFEWEIWYFKQYFNLAAASTLNVFIWH